MVVDFEVAYFLLVLFLRLFEPHQLVDDGLGVYSCCLYLVFQIDVLLFQALDHPEQSIILGIVFPNLRLELLVWLYKLFSGKGSLLRNVSTKYFHVVWV